MADEKDSTPRTEAVAHLKFARVGPRKFRRVADAIRGKSVREALILLKFSGVFASEPLEKLVNSAVANAANNFDMETENLYIRTITVDGGPGGRFTKRLDPRAQGRAAFKRKRMSHVTLVVGAKPDKEKPRRPGASIALSINDSRTKAANKTRAPRQRRSTSAPTGA